MVWTKEHHQSYKSDIFIIFFLVNLPELEVRVSKTNVHRQTAGGTKALASQELFLLLLGLTIFYYIFYFFCFVFFLSIL